MTAAKTLNDVRVRIACAAKAAGRDVSDVTLVAVSKTFDADAIRPLLDAGQRVFGENRVQEAADKWPTLRADFPETELHFIGQLQSNKAEGAAELFDVIHSVDRMSLVKALAKSARRPACFIQVNLGGESQKGGCAPDAVAGLIAALEEANLPVLGLMCLPPLDKEPAPYFALLAKIAREHGLSGLSMGMSGDFETAIMLGASHVRVGSALFGARENH